VDNKRLSRRLAAAHDIPTPDLFGVVETHRDLRRTPALVAGRTAFVVKPARGAAGNGIVLIGSGTTTTAVQGREVVALHPDTRQPVEDLRVPHWERILTIAAQACEMTGLGYLGADLLIDRERGPLLLELNARPGLAVQLANRDGLHRRLGLVDRSVAPGMSVAERVALARSLFP
jgi:glutathione synthase/RimK-type ligase-like ATP-grasp enzyme